MINENQIEATINSVSGQTTYEFDLSGYDDDFTQAGTYQFWVVAISDNANTLAAAIRAKLIEDGEKPKAKPVIDPDAGADLFVTLPCAAYIPTVIESADALKQAEERLIEMISAFDFEQQEIYSNPEIGGTASTLF